MHISEGILSAPILISGGLVSTLGTMIGLRHLDYERLMTTALLASTFFVASLVHVPLGPGSMHLLLGGLLGLILGWAAFPAILIALLLQALFFQYGGLLVLGVNTMNIAGPAVLCGLLFRPWLGQGHRRQALAGFLAGFLALLLASLLHAATLWLSDPGFQQAATLLIIAHLPVMVIEGGITLFIVRFLLRVQPEILGLKP